MNVVIIEDDPIKADRVRAAVIDSLPSAAVEIYQSYQTGLRALLEHDSDLVILDMSLPTYDPVPNRRQGRPRPLGGVDIMRKLRRRNRPARVVVLTALENFGTRDAQFTFEELVRMCEAEFSDIFLGAIYYSQSKTNWRDQLKAKISSL